MAEIDELRAQLAQANGECEQYRDALADRDAELARVEARAERAEAKIARVEALVEQADAYTGPMIHVEYVRAALAAEGDTVVNEPLSASRRQCPGVGQPGKRSDGGYPACPVCGREFCAQGRKARARLGNCWAKIPRHFRETA